jgi:thiol-disulfide isomerase/thioredoxin
VGSFWVDADVADAMLRQNDSYGAFGVQGLPETSGQTRSQAVVMVNKKRLFSFVFITLNLGSFIPYAQWWKDGPEDGRHYVLVSAQWCEPCQRMKAELKTAALAKNQNVIILDVDELPELAKKINPSGQIPLLVEYTREDGKWKSRHDFKGDDLDKFLRGE